MYANEILDRIKSDIRRGNSLSIEKFAISVFRCASTSTELIQLNGVLHFVCVCVCVRALQIVCCFIVGAKFCDIASETVMLHTAFCMFIRFLLTIAM